MATLHACRVFNPHEAFPLNKQAHLPFLIKRKKQLSKSINAVATDIITSDPTQVEITWQIVIGSLAGVTPFVVAGVEFSKRIVKQRKCEVCGGSGLVLKKKYYKRCPNCGGFLPWQSWRRFFTGLQGWHDFWAKCTEITAFEVLRYPLRVVKGSTGRRVGFIENSSEE